ncbi:GntR family transcriptional regulator [Alsobacter soli]|uniref:GntR family transcriptional regulator n=1 Tax=Alsobacter soli TaxID=2109933 RepID=A0A2T1HYD9_9HYPH|nr:GntR family transcriptional regulator [Alsobacter soli]PSC06600.1 GntR family transcriptional regulator [Alsobacter soli]
MAFSKLERSTAAAQVLEALREQILSGDIPGGEQLRQERIAEELGVSRVPVREALNQLEAEGLVRIVSHKGAVVTRLSLDELREAYEIRAQLEAWLLRLSIPNLAADDFLRAEAILAELDAAAPEQWSDLNWAFHVALYRPAARPQAVSIARKMYLNAYRHLPVPARVMGHRDRMQREHRSLLRLCRERDVEGACRALDAHIADAAAGLIAVLSSGPAAEAAVKTRKKKGRSE